jgi:hypothetical protein
MRALPLVLGMSTYPVCLRAGQLLLDCMQEVAAAAAHAAAAGVGDCAFAELCTLTLVPATGNLNSHITCTYDRLLTLLLLLLLLLLLA